MRLLTHNFLACLQCESFPLDVEATAVEVLAVEYDAEFCRRMLARCDYSFLVKAFRSLKASHEAEMAKGGEGYFAAGEDLPDSLEGVDLGDDSVVLRLVHFAMNMVAVRDGAVKCSACAQLYPIREFIPNFVVEGKK